MTVSEALEALADQMELTSKPTRSDALAWAMELEKIQQQVKSLEEMKTSQPSPAPAARRPRGRWKDLPPPKRKK